MAKVSRPMVYTGLAAVVAYAIFIYATPDKPAAKHVLRVSSSRTVNADGTDPRDTAAHFAPYTAGKRDPFTPKVVIKKAFTAVTPVNAAQGKWSLTGVSEIDGVRSALVENDASGDGIFLKVGDRWNGLRVLSVDNEQIVFANALGQQTKLAFSDNDPPAEGDTKLGTTNGTVTVPSAPPLPTTVRPLPPLQIVPTATSRISSQGNSNQP